MKLRSSRVLERGIPIIDLGLENQDFSSERRLSLRSNKSNFGKKGAEIGVGDDNCDRNLEKEEVTSPNVDCENGSENLEADAFADDTMIVIDPENANVLDNRKLQIGKGGCWRKKKNVVNSKTNESNQKKRDSVSSVNGANECTVAPLKLNKVRKRNNVEDSEPNGNVRVNMEEVDEDEVRVSARLLRSRSLITVSGGDMAVDCGLSRTLKRRGRPPMVWSEIKDGNPRPKKKLKRRGRPPKVQVEVTQNKYGSLTQKPRKKLKRRGRPPKLVSHEIPLGPKKSRGRPRKVLMTEVVSKGVQKKRAKTTTFKKPKRHGSVPKVDPRTLAEHVTRMRTMKRKAVNKRPKVPKIVKHEENSEQVIAEGVIGEHLERGKYKQLIRDKISDILLKSGWLIDHRQRQQKMYKDAVYIEPSGKRTHWSITRAYAMLKKKIEDGDANSYEIAAYSPIPEEEIRVLFRQVDKKKKHKKKKLGKQTKSGSKRKPVFKPRGDKITNSRKAPPLARGSGLKEDKDGVVVIKKKRNLLSWMIDSGFILVGCKVRYGKTRRQKKLFEGTVTEDGICCGCCNEIMGIYEFVGHCGGKTTRCYDNLFLESGTCFRNCLVDSWRKEEESNIVKFNVIDVKGDDSNDDICNICGDGGNLICCDGCPSTFHQSCLDIQNFPSGDWNCIYCSCKFCGVVSVTTSQVEGSHDTITSEMLSCYLCEEKFHRLCLQEVEVVNIDSDRLTFCGRKCQEIYERLQKYLGVKHELEDGFSWTLLQRSDVGQDFTVHATQLKVEHNSKLAVAFSVMDECFVPIIDERSGTNVIRNVVYRCGSNFKRLNYAGFLTAVLEKGDELITAASIRIHGFRLAEMPFIGTRHMYRRQGMCRRLLDAIESTLSSVGVEDLIIPAIPELLQTWTKVFGFMSLEDSKKQAIKCMSMMVFPGIDMLIKPLVQNQSADINSIPSAGLISVTSDDVVAEDTTEPNDENVEKDATEQMEESTFRKDTIEDEQTEEPAVEKDVIVTHLKNENLINSHGAFSLCDLNYPVNLLPCDTDGGQTSVDSESLTDPETCGNHQLPALKLDVENDGVKVKPSEVTSELVPKNTFDLNLHPTVVETDMHHIIGDDSQVCLKAFEVCDSRLHVDHIAASQTDSKPRESQPLVML